MAASTQPNKRPWVWLAVAQWLYVNGVVYAVLALDPSNPAHAPAGGWYGLPGRLMMGLTGSLLLFELLAIGVSRTRMGRWIAVALCLFGAASMLDFAVRWSHDSLVIASACVVSGAALIYLAWRMTKDPAN